MAERRKIIIQTGAAPDEPLPTPHFDAEATMTARPVVPLNDQEAHQAHYGNYAGRPAAKPFWKRPALLALIVLVAVGIGVAAGLAIGIYRNRNAAETPIATTPPPTVEDANAGQTVEQQPQPAPTEQTRAAVPAEEPEETAAAEPKVEERERTARNERKDEDDDDEARPPVAAKQPVVREKKPVKIDEYVIEDEREARQAEKEQRREERRAERRERRRRGREDEMNLPRGIERGRREVDRIREIFEGRQP